MPFIIPFLPIIAEIAGIGGAGLTIGETIAHAVGGSSPTPTTPPGPTPPNAQQLLQKQAVIGQQEPNWVSAGSGTLSPAFIQLMASLNSGVLGTPGANAAGTAATGQQFTPANNQPTNAAVNGQPINLADVTGLFG